MSKAAKPKPNPLPPTPGQLASDKATEKWFRENDSAIPEPGDETWDYHGEPLPDDVVAQMPYSAAMVQMIAENAAGRKAGQQDQQPMDQQDQQPPEQPAPRTKPAPRYKRKKHK